MPVPVSVTPRDPPCVSVPTLPKSLSVGAVYGLREDGDSIRVFTIFSVISMQIEFGYRGATLAEQSR